MVLTARASKLDALVPELVSNRQLIRVSNLTVAAAQWDVMRVFRLPHILLPVLPDVVCVVLHV